MNNQVALPRILVYQDEDCSIMTDYLQFYGFDVITSTEEDIIPKIKSCNYDLCILSHYKANLPGDLRLLTALRKVDNKAPVILVSDQSRYEYILDAFDAGVDDYVIRPYNLEELIRRIKAVLRRCGVKVRAIELTYQIGKYVFNTEDNTLVISGAETKLTSKESKTLALLCAYQNELLPRKVLMQHVWTDDNYFNKRSLDVHMCNLRNYLKMDKRISIETRRGIGYSLVIEEE
jgi:DNA-binding response regulator rprY